VKISRRSYIAFPLFGQVPIAVRVLLAFLDVGFVLREDVIKLQWKMKTTRER